MGKLKDRLGEVRVNNQGLEMKIIEYRKAIDIDVEFEDGSIVKNREYGKFKKGQIRNLYYPETYGVGFIGIGKHKTTENGKATKTYSIWYSMLQRVYSEKYQEKFPTYTNCTVCEEWLNFQNFAKWYKDNLWVNDCVVLDKDILVKGNKTYSPKTCVLVDNRINSLFTKSDKCRGKYPIGVYYDKNAKIFKTSCSVLVDGKKQNKYLGRFNTPFEAFNVYKQFKEDYIKQIADEYKDKYKIFPIKLYSAMCSYEVDIND